MRNIKNVSLRFKKCGSSDRIARMSEYTTTEKNSISLARV